MQEEDVAYFPKQEACLNYFSFVLMQELEHRSIRRMFLRQYLTPKTIVYRRSIFLSLTSMDLHKPKSKGLYPREILVYRQASVYVTGVCGPRYV